MKNFFKNKNNLIIGLCAVVLIMGIGFAGFSQNLQINETSSSTTEWNVYISNAVVGNKSENATATITKAQGLEASFVTTLQSPGDKVVYNVTVKNDGNVTATLDELNLNTTNNNSVILYSHAGIEEGDTLASGESKTFTVTVEYDPTKTGTATEAQKKNSGTLQLNFVQGSGTSGEDNSVGSESAASTLIAKAVTSGDGLYTDPVEAGRYVYKGADPDNYIVLDGATYRIVSVEADNTIKVVKQYNIGCMAWDSSGNRTASGRLYCTSTHCNAWGSSTTTLDANGNNVTEMPREAGSTTTYALPSNEASLNTILNGTFLNGLNTELKNKIATHTFNIGPLKQASGQTLATDISQESAYKWSGKIALINATDYVRASTNSACTSVYGYVNTSNCYNNSDTHNYLFHSSQLEWTLSPYSHSRSSNVWYVDSGGRLNSTSANLGNYGVWPSFYLTSDISLSGEGTPNEPYCIEGVNCVVSGTESNVRSCGSSNSGGSGD